MEKIWFTSDTHFGHKNILKYSERDFESLDAMDEAMIHNWNERVSPEDLVYHLGDVGLCSQGKLRKILDRLQGRIRLIRGNHESSAEACHSRFEWIKDYYELEMPDPDAYQGKRFIVLFHYAMREWNASHHGTWHLYGHSHGTLPDDPNSLSIDIGVDCHGYRPLDYAEIKALMSQKTWVSPFAKGQNR